MLELLGLARLQAPGLLWVYGLLGSVHLVYALDRARERAAGRI